MEWLQNDIVYITKKNELVIDLKDKYLFNFIIISVNYRNVILLKMNQQNPCRKTKRFFKVYIKTLLIIIQLWLNNFWNINLIIEGIVDMIKFINLCH